MSAADLLTGLRTYLLAQPAVVALAPSGIHASELHEDQTPGMPAGAIVIRSSGGIDLHGSDFAEKATQRIDLFAFGATPYEADRLRAEASLALKRLRRGVFSGVLIDWVNPASGPSDGREPVVEWPRSFQSFQASYALEVVE